MSNVPVVREFMVTKLVTLRPEMDIFVAIDLLLKHHISGAPVVDAEQRLVGILSEKDCLRVVASGAFHRSASGQVEDYMSREVQTVDPEADVFRVADMFLTRSFRRLPVLEQGKLVGQVSRRDVLNASRKVLEESTVQKPWTDARYLTDEIKAALADKTPPSV